jgi:hypothetical protein
MKKLLPILVIFLTSIIAREALSLPNCLGTWSASSWNNCVGQYIWTDGDKWIGEWKYGEIDGKGTYTFADGDKFTGEYIDGESNGQGVYIWGDTSEWAGDKYVGEFIDGERTGAAGDGAAGRGGNFSEGLAEFLRDHIACDYR